LRVLFAGDCANVAANLARGLEGRGVSVSYVQKSLRDPDRPSDVVLYDKYDIVHVSYPFHLWKARLALKARHLVLHWHGSDARNYFVGWPVKKFLRERAEVNLVSTVDLNYWIPEGKHFLGCVDTSVFRPMPEVKKKKGLLEWGRGRSSVWIPHLQLPYYLNQFRAVEVFPSHGLSPKLVSVSALEAAACGLRVRHHPYMTRKWVIENAGVEAAASRLLGVYAGVGVE